MNLPAAIFPNETYLDGLSQADPSVLESIYNEFRQPIVKAVELAGGNYADGTAFFRVALIQMACLVKENKYPTEIPVEQFLQQLAVRQLLDWRMEKTSEEPPVQELTEQELAIQEQLPTQDSLRYFRGMIKAKRTFYRLETEDQKQVLGIAQRIQQGEIVSESDLLNPALVKYKKNLGIIQVEPQSLLDGHIVEALTNPHFHLVWTACDAIEQRQPSAQIPTGGENKAIKYAFITLMVLSLGYAIISWFFRDQSPAEVYDQHFKPPSSIVADMAQRYAKDSIVPERPESCTIVFKEADAYYQKKEWRMAAGTLADMMDDAYKPCQSDALFYLAIIGLQMEKPDLTLECISKIEDLERFGEDIYWYMALAYVKKAALDPSEKEIARRAVERALSNTEIPERRAQAEKMLSELAD